MENDQREENKEAEALKEAEPKLKDEVLAIAAEIKHLKQVEDLYHGTKTQLEQL